MRRLVFDAREPVNEETLERILTGEVRSPQRKTVEALAEALDVPVERILKKRESAGT